MYGMFNYISLICIANVGKYAHGSYGSWSSTFPGHQFPVGPATKDDAREIPL